MLNRVVGRAAELLALLAVLAASSSCREEGATVISKVPHPMIEPLSACQSTGRIVDCRLTVAPGILLMRVAGLPEERLRSPQTRIWFHWQVEDSLTDVPEIEIYVWAENRFGAARVGSVRLSKVQPAPTLWRRNVCFPVPCDLFLPIAAERTSWNLTARVRGVGITARKIDLGTVTLG